MKRKIYLSFALAIIYLFNTLLFVHSVDYSAEAYGTAEKSNELQLFSVPTATEIGINDRIPYIDGYQTNNSMNNLSKTVVTASAAKHNVTNVLSEDLIGTGNLEGITEFPQVAAIAYNVAGRWCSQDGLGTIENATYPGAPNGAKSFKVNTTNTSTNSGMYNRIQRSAEDRNSDNEYYFTAWVKLGESNFDAASLISDIRLRTYPMPFNTNANAGNGYGYIVDLNPQASGNVFKISKEWQRVEFLFKLPQHDHSVFEIRFYCNETGVLSVGDVELYRVESELSATEIRFEEFPEEISVTSDTGETTEATKVVPYNAAVNDTVNYSISPQSAQAYVSFDNAAVRYDGNPINNNIVINNEEFVRAVQDEVDVTIKAEQSGGGYTEKTVKLKNRVSSGEHIITGVTLPYLSAYSTGLSMNNLSKTIVTDSFDKRVIKNVLSDDLIGTGNLESITEFPQVAAIAYNVAGRWCSQDGLGTLESATYPGAPDGAKSFKVNTTNTSTNSGIYNRIERTAEDKNSDNDYYFSAWVKLGENNFDAVSAISEIRLRTYPLPLNTNADIGNGYGFIVGLNPTESDNLFKISTEWKKIEFVFKLPSHNHDLLEVRFFSNEIGTLYVSDVELYRVESAHGLYYDVFPKEYNISSNDGETTIPINAVLGDGSTEGELNFSIFPESARAYAKLKENTISCASGNLANEIIIDNEKFIEAVTNGAEVTVRAEHSLGALSTEGVIKLNKLVVPDRLVVSGSNSGIIPLNGRKTSLYTVDVLKNDKIIDFNGEFNWSIEPASNGVTVDDNGILYVDANAAVGTVSVVVQIDNGLGGIIRGEASVALTKEKKASATGSSGGSGKGTASLPSAVVPGYAVAGVETQQPEVTDKKPSKATDYSGHWSESMIKDLLNEGIISGDSETGNMRPDDEITKEEAIKIILSILKINPVSGELRQGDTTSKWACGYVLAAKEAGIISVDDTGLFNANKPATRAEIATIVARALKLHNGDVTQLDKFNDGGEVPDWARISMAVLIEKGVILGFPDNTVKPESLITRSAVFAIAYRIK